MNLKQEQIDAIKTAPVTPSSEGSYGGSPTMYERGFEQGARMFMMFWLDGTCMNDSPKEITKIGEDFRRWYDNYVQNLSNEKP